jgi:transposase
MLYLAIDQHRKQLTVNLRDEEGHVLLARQVSTQWDRVRTFLGDLRQQAQAAGGFVAIVEVCGFNDWLCKILGEYGCVDIVLVRATTRSRTKTDRRDAAALGELLWTNRGRLAAGDKLQHLRRVTIPSADDAEDRQLTALRKRLGEFRTRVLNKIQRILLRHNLQQDCPTKTLSSQAARGWLKKLPLGDMDRVELDLLFEQWTLLDRQIQDLQQKIVPRQAHNPAAALIASIPGAGGYTALALASRIGDIGRFPRPSSLVNYWGLAPGCRNSGDATRRLGSITKEGSALARFLLGQLVLHVLRKDPGMKSWYGGIKKRRGAKIARVAVMRRLTTILWHMLRRGEPYVLCRVTKPCCATKQQRARSTPRDVAGTREGSRRDASRLSNQGSNPKRKFLKVS